MSFLVNMYLLLLYFILVFTKSLKQPYCMNFHFIFHWTAVFLNSNHFLDLCHFPHWSFICVWPFVPSTVFMVMWDSCKLLGFVFRKPFSQKEGFQGLFYIRKLIVYFISSAVIVAMLHLKK